METESRKLTCFLQINPHYLNRNHIWMVSRITCCLVTDLSSSHGIVIQFCKKKFPVNLQQLTSFIISLKSSHFLNDKSAHCLRIHNKIQFKSCLFARNSGNQYKVTGSLISDQFKWWFCCLICAMSAHPYFWFLIDFWKCGFYFLHI